MRRLVGICGSHLVLCGCMLVTACNSHGGSGGTGGANAGSSGSPAETGGTKGVGGAAGASPTPGSGGVRGTAGANGGHVGTGSGGVAGGGGGSNGSAGTFTSSFKLAVRPKLDLLLLVDNSPSMAPHQTKMVAQIGAFVNALADQASGHLPDLHIAVISPSFGSGAWNNIPQCLAGAHPGDDRGFFQQGPGGAGSGACPMLHAGATFLDTGDGVTSSANYDGDIRDAFRCVAMLGEGGCNYVSPFESTYFALSYAAKTKAEHPQNGGFLRPEAKLAILMLTNQDDCSVRADSSLLNGAVNSVSDPSGLGAASTYRCNEFGHLCEGASPPHEAPTGTGVTLLNCVSAEDNGKGAPLAKTPSGQPDTTGGHLWPTVAEFTSAIRAYKANADDVFVAAIAGPVDPYHIGASVNASAGNELVPKMDYSCTQAPASASSPEFAYPAVRIKQWVSNFYGNGNGLFYPICADVLNKAMVGVAARIRQGLTAICVPRNVAWVDDSDHSKGHVCEVRKASADANSGDVTALPECRFPIDNAPCYRLNFNGGDCPGFPSSRVAVEECDDAACTVTAPGPPGASLSISCKLDTR